MNSILNSKFSFQIQSFEFFYACCIKVGEPSLLRGKLKSLSGFLVKTCRYKSQATKLKSRPISNNAQNTTYFNFWPFVGIIPVCEPESPPLLYISKLLLWKSPGLAVWLNLWLMTPNEKPSAVDCHLQSGLFWKMVHKNTSSFHISMTGG